MKQKKTILHVIDTTGPGGAETVCTQLAHETLKQGFNTIALIRGPGWVESELSRLGIRTIIKNCKGSLNVEFLTFLIRLIKDERINIIQSHLLGSNVYTSLAGLITRIPVISTFHGFVDVSNKERFRTLKFLSIRFGSKYVIAVTEQLKDMLIDNTVLPSRKVQVLSNGIDTSLFKEKTHQDVNNNRIVQLGCLGNVRFAKNYPMAIEVLKLLVCDRKRNVHLHIAGDDKNELASKCKQLVEQYGLQGRVTWHGFLNSAPDYLHSLDIFLLTSSTEGHPLALTQAMSVGLPIVATKCGVEHIVADETSALLVDNGNSQEFADQVCRFLDNPELCRAIGSTAAKEARDKWSLTSCFKRYFSLYEDV